MRPNPNPVITTRRTVCPSELYHRMHAVPHGQGRASWAERLETEAARIQGLMTDAPNGSNVGHLNNIHH